MFPPERSFFVQKKGRRKSTCLRLSRNPEIRENGKEDSYERNPGGVSFVFNQLHTELQKVLCASAGCRNYSFGNLNSPSIGRGIFFCLHEMNSRLPSFYR